VNVYVLADLCNVFFSVQKWSCTYFFLQYIVNDLCNVFFSVQKWSCMYFFLQYIVNDLCNVFFSVQKWSCTYFFLQYMSTENDRLWMYFFLRENVKKFDLEQMLRAGGEKKKKKPDGKIFREKKCFFRKTKVICPTEISRGKIQRRGNS
jgi:hypothetical protein